MNNTLIKSIQLIFACSVLLIQGCRKALPDSFCKLSDVSPRTLQEVRYASENNFMGRVVTGYESEEIYITRRAAVALSQVQKELEKEGLGLKVFDAYRPQRAVDDFVDWAKDLTDTVKKSTYYPDVPKDQLFARGYIAAKSGHSRGSTVDLTIIDLETKVELDMGSPWDYFGIQSHGNYLPLEADQLANRKLLKDLMVKHGFTPLPEEWWHFTLKDEPYPDTYFDFPIE